MKRFASIILIICSGFFLFLSCDKIEPPYTRNGGIIPPPTDTVVRKVLLEEFTGQRCPNCPAASTLAHELQAIYPSNLILLAIHAGNFADPTAAPFDYDFRTSVGDSLNNYYHIAGYPSGMVSRVQYSTGNFVTPKNLWETTYGTIVSQAPVATLSLTTAYEEATRKATATIETKFLQDADTAYNLCVYLTENNIVKPQQMPDTIYHAYTHMHVLRGAFNGAFGNKVAGTGTVSGAIINKSYTMILKSDFNPDNCTVIAFLIKSDGDYEIVQAAEKALK